MSAAVKPTSKPISKPADALVPGGEHRVDRLRRRKSGIGLICLIWLGAEAPRVAQRLASSEQSDFLQLGGS